MAVVGTATERYASRDGDESLSGDRTYIRIFTVHTDHRGDGARQVRLAAGVPRVGDTYSTTRESDGGVLCQNVTANQIATLVWEVTCNYATQSADGGGDPERQDENPLARPPDVSWGSATYSKRIWKDLVPKSVINSAGQPFDPPLSVDQSRLVLTITRNEPEFDWNRAIEYSDTLNEGEFFGRIPGEAKMSTPRANLQYENGVSFWRVTYEIHFHPEGWAVKVLDAGTFYWQVIEVSGGTETNEKRPFTADDQPGIVGLLDGTGEALSDARRKAGDVVYREYHVYESKDFSVFNLEPQ